MSNGIRFRERGGYSPVAYSYSSNTGIVSSGTIASSGSYDTMTDIVSAPFVPGKTIKTNGVKQTSTVKSYTPCSGSQTFSGTGGIVSYSGTCPWWGNWENKITEVAHSVLPRSDHLVSLAATQALSNAQKGDGDLLVSLVELRSTINGLLKPLTGASEFLSSVSKRKKAKALKGIANQHLSIIFGLMPFMQDIQTVLGALGTVPLTVRKTYRGYASDSKDNSFDEDVIVYDSGGTRESRKCSIVTNRTMHARAWLLCEREINMNQLLGFRLSSVPRAVILASPYSFIVDWFANLSDFVGAITPNPDIRILSQGWSLDDITSGYAHGEYRLARNTSTGPNGWTGLWSGGKQSYFNRAKVRYPAELSELVGLHLKSNIHKDTLDLFKITALSSLVTQRLVR